MFGSVSDKAGAAFTTKHITATLVVVVGTAEECTHLKKLSVMAVRKSIHSQVLLWATSLQLHPV